MNRPFVASSAFAFAIASLPGIAAAASPFGQDPANYEPTFSEEFEAGFSATRWNTRIWYEASNPTINYAVSYGSLKIWPQRDSTGKFFNRTIDTDGKYYQLYGYYEIDAKLPKGKGTWPAFWLLSHSNASRPEIDILKTFTGGTGWSKVNSNGIHYPVAYNPAVWVDAGKSAGSRMVSTPDLSATYNKYGLKWEPSKLTFYFNGKEVHSVNASLTTPMYILLSLWHGGAAGTPDSTTPTGSSNAYDIRYVRAWKIKATSTNPAPAPSPTPTPTPSPAPATATIDYYGDSTIWGYASGRGGQVALPAPAAFAAKLPSYNLPTQYTVRNEGVSGTTACQLLNGTDGRHPAWDTQMANSTAKTVIINFAINDQWKYSLANYKSCMTSLIQKAKSGGKKVILETPNPTRDSAPNSLDLWVAAMREVATQQNVPVIDQYTYLKNYLAGRSVYDICPDGLHPSDAVYKMKGEYAAKVFAAMPQ